MILQLSRVTESLVSMSHQCLSEVTHRLKTPFPDVLVEPLGSSFFAGSLSKGDIDLLVSAPAASFTLVIHTLLEQGHRAQPENWTSTFASIALDLGGSGECNIQLVRSDCPTLATLRAQTQTLSDPTWRRRYDRAKQHGNPLGPTGYWQVKDAFWSTWQKDGPQWRPAERPVLKILREEEWRQLIQDGESLGAPIDHHDGFVHLSTPEQVHETVAKHFAGVNDLWLLTLDAEALGLPLRWEPSRGGALFPHLYGPLRLSDVCLVRPWTDSQAHTVAG